MKILYATAIVATLLGICLFLLMGCTTQEERQARAQGHHIGWTDNQYNQTIPINLERIAIALENMAGTKHQPKQKENEICE